MKKFGQSFVKFVEKIMPFHGFIMLLLVLLLNMVTYFGTRLFTANLYHHTLSSRLDDMIPFESFFVLFYVLAFAQWIFGYIMIAREDRQFCDRYLTGEMIAKLLCLVCFIAYPTTLARSSYETAVANGTSFWDFVTNIIYTLDSPDNLFPSIHCLESYVCMRTAFGMKHMKHKRIYTIYNVLMSLCVFASTVFLKQHVVADMFGAIAVAEIGFGLSGLIYRKRNRNLETTNG